MSRHFFSIFVGFAAACLCLLNLIYRIIDRYWKVLRWARKVWESLMCNIKTQEFYLERLIRHIRGIWNLLIALLKFNLEGQGDDGSSDGIILQAKSRQQTFKNVLDPPLKIVLLKLMYGQWHVRSMKLGDGSIDVLVYTSTYINEQLNEYHEHKFSSDRHSRGGSHSLAPLKSGVDSRRNSNSLYSRQLWCTLL